MAYIGNPEGIGTGFSRIDSQQFSGTGSATAFTMRHSISHTTHIEVFVNNVRQDPHMAYNVSGTTLTFTEAPDNATNNIYVVYTGGAVNTTELPRLSSLSLQDGMKAAPSLFRGSQIATGMHFPAANSIAFVQGNKEILKANNSIIELKISGTTVATINSSGMNIAGSVYDDGTAIGTITANTQLGSATVTSHAIASGNVTSTELRSSGLLTANTQFNAGIITAHAIAAGAVGGSELATGAVSANTKIAANIIDASNIKAGAVGASELATGAVSANTKIGSGVITAVNLANDSIGPQHLQAGAVNANTVLATGAITADLIATGAVGPTEIAAGAISANTKMAADVVGAREIRIGNLAAANAVFTHNSSTYAKAQLGRVESVTVGAANVAVNFANCNIFNLTLGISTHLNLPTNVTAGQAGTIIVKQDGSGSRTLSYAGAWEFPSGTAPTLSTTASAEDRIDYVVVAANAIHAVATLNYG